MSILIGLAHEAIFNAVWPSVIVNQRLLRFIEIKKIVAYMLDS